MPDHFELAVQLHQAGQLEQAEIHYKLHLRRYPDHSESIQNLGVIALQSERYDLAVILLRRAIKLAPQQPGAYSNLGNALLRLGEGDEALDALRHAVRLDPAHIDGLNNLSIALLNAGKHEESAAVLERLLAIQPQFPEGHFNLGYLRLREKKFDLAVQSFLRTLALRPDYIAAYMNLADALQSVGRVDHAIETLKAVLQLDPRNAQAYYNLANLLNRLHRFAEAVPFMKSAVVVDPDFWEAHNALGSLLIQVGDFDSAIASFRNSLQLKPDTADAWANLGLALKDVGDFEDAVSSLRKAIELAPHNSKLASDHILTLHYQLPQDHPAIVSELNRWGERFGGEVIRSEPVAGTDRSLTRRLRVGYVSSDWNLHPVGRFITPVMQGYSKAEFDVHCFSHTVFPDAATEGFKKSAAHWHDITDLDNQAVADLIRRLDIDILVDLSLHTGNSRVCVFALRPAPIQLSHLAYCGSSGIRQMDYVMADRYLHQASDGDLFVEQVFPLPNSYWCYRPLPDVQAVSTLPAEQNGYVTFGSMNNFCKATPEVLKTWCAILRANTHSRLLLHARPGMRRQNILRTFELEGIDSSRIQFAEFEPIHLYTRQYHRIDIQLDTFPFVGGTTTCDSLYMGVPVVSLAGRTPLSRGGLSILSNVGLPELVAYSTEQYIQIATDLAADLPRLAELRRTMRARMQNSPLMDEKQYVADLEAAYRTMWKTWCENSSSKPNPGGP